jgi:RNA-directed DNA polymerase
MQEGGCVRDQHKEDQRTTVPYTVPFTATPAREPPSVQEWANRSVWTKHMLAALETGVRGGRWHTLMDKVFALQPLFQASQRVLENEGVAGVDGQTVDEFAKYRMREIQALSESLRNGTYRPQSIRRAWIPKPGSTEKRPLGIPTVRDRVVQAALLQVLEPIFDVTFSERSYGFRHGRGCHQALEAVESLLAAGYVHIVDADLKSYFDTIPKERLLERVRSKVSDSRVLRLVEMFLEQKIMEDFAEWTPEAGTPQGAVLSPLLANIYLDPLDHEMAAAGIAMLRYADDFVILCRSREDAQAALSRVQEWVQANGLTLHPAKTRIVDARTEEFQFLGYLFRGTLRLPRATSVDKLKEHVRRKTQRGRSGHLKEIIKSLNYPLVGWFAYFRHCTSTTYRPLDQWVRMRVRSILRRRRGRRGRGRGLDNQLWPNAYFVNVGLCSLQAAHRKLCQSLPR